MKWYKVIWESVFPEEGTESAKAMGQASMACLGNNEVDKGTMPERKGEITWDLTGIAKTLFLPSRMLNSWWQRVARPSTHGFALTDLILSPLLSSLLGHVHVLRTGHCVWRLLRPLLGKDLWGTCHYSQHFWAGHWYCSSLLPEVLGSTLCNRGGWEHRISACFRVMSNISIKAPSICLEFQDTHL